MEFGYRFVCGRGITSDQTCHICSKKTRSTTHTYICLLINGFKIHLDGPRTDTASIGSTHATPHPPQKGSGENATIEDVYIYNMCNYLLLLFYMIYHIICYVIYRCYNINHISFYVQHKPTLPLVTQTATPEALLVSSGAHIWCSFSWKLKLTRKYETLVAKNRPL